MAMQKTIVLITLLFSIPALSQTMDGKNQVKLNLSAFVFKGFNLQYERQVSAKVTVALGYGMIPESAIPFKSYVKKQVYIQDVNIADFRLGTSVITPEARYYFSEKGAFHGFYLAPYARFGSYKIKGPVLYSDASGLKKSADFAGKLHTITGGLMAGYNWQLSYRFYFDLWIAGGSFGGENGTFTTNAQLPASDQESLKRKLESISLKGITLTSEVNNNGAVVKTSGSIPGVRGLGINVGIRF